MLYHICLKHIVIGELIDLYIDIFSNFKCCTNTALSSLFQNCMKKIDPIYSSPSD